MNYYESFDVEYLSSPLVMHMLNWKIEEIRLPLKYTWKISRNSSDFKLNSIIIVTDGIHHASGETAPNIRYNETPELMKTEFVRFKKAFYLSQYTAESPLLFNNFLDTLHLPNALRFGIESAFIHYYCNSTSQQIYNVLKTEPVPNIFTSFSLPIMDIGDIENFYHANKLSRFKRLKIKVNVENALLLVTEIHRITKQPLIIDGNESWKDPDKVLLFMDSIKNYPVEIIEQPLPSSMMKEYEYLKSKSRFPLFADESICADADFGLLIKQFHGINMKLMKAGGYLNGLRLLNEARAYGLRTMVGCMVETTLGISSAMRVCKDVDFADLDGFLIIKDEPFQLVTEGNGILELN